MTTESATDLAGRSGTRVTATDLDTGESTTWEILDTYVLIVDGVCYLDGQQIYGNGTHTLTIKGGGRGVGKLIEGER